MRAPQLMLLLPFALACAVDDPYKDAPRDDEGCWTDPDLAWEAVQRQNCSDDCEIDESDADWQECMEWETGHLSLHRDEICFDGCLVDPCLDAWAEYRKSCDESFRVNAEDICKYEGPLWFDEVRECPPDKQGI